MNLRKSLITICALALCTALTAQVKKIGIIGLDTSHSPAFTKIINDTSGKYKDMGFDGYRITAAYPFGSQSIAVSRDRIAGFTKDVEKYGVRIVGSIDELLAEVDFVLLETNDGNLHLEQAAKVFKAGKPMFIDKPVAASLEDAIAIYELARHYNVACFSSSSLRYSATNAKLATELSGTIIGADSYGPAKREPSHPDFSWYGIHAVEALFTVMGGGCKSVTRSSTDGTEVVVGVWNDGRIGTFRGNIAAKGLFGGTIFTATGAYPMGTDAPYDMLLREVIKFFNTGKVPVTEQQTLDIFTFMEASNLSKAKGGCPVLTQRVFDNTKRKAMKKVGKYIK